MLHNHKRKVRNMGYKEGDIENDVRPGSANP